MNTQELARSADRASDFLKSLANPLRLRILCMIMERERPVGDIAEELGVRQTAVSQHLALLRKDGLVAPRRDGQTIHYRLADRNVRKVVKLLYELFCKG
ncbi:MAG: metalloregulator ArsR/SmtB family transcription factor [Hyphomicrobiales bacterium]